MFKSLMLLLAFSFCSLTISAQKITYNISAKYSLTRFIGYSGVDIKPGYKLGGGATYHFNERYSLSTSLFFCHKAMSKDNIKSYSFAEGYAEYLELPVNVGIRLKKYNHSEIRLVTGLYVNCGIGGTAHAYIDDREVCTVDTFGKDGIKRFDFGYSLGGHFKWRHFIFGIDGQIGFLRLLKDTNVHNLDGSFSISYSF